MVHIRVPKLNATELLFRMESKTKLLHPCPAGRISKSDTILEDNGYNLESFVAISRV